MKINQQWSLAGQDIVCLISSHIMQMLCVVDIIEWENFKGHKFYCFQLVPQKLIPRSLTIVASYR